MKPLLDRLLDGDADLPPDLRRFADLLTEARQLQAVSGRAAESTEAEPDLWLEAEADCLEEEYSRPEGQRWLAAEAERLGMTREEDRGFSICACDQDDSTYVFEGPPWRITLSVRPPATICLSGPGPARVWLPTGPLDLSPEVWVMAGAPGVIPLSMLLRPADSNEALSITLRY